MRPVSHGVTSRDFTHHAVSATDTISQILPRTASILGLASFVSVGTVIGFPTTQPVQARSSSVQPCGCSPRWIIAHQGCCTALDARRQTTDRRCRLAVPLTRRRPNPAADYHRRSSKFRRHSLGCRPRRWQKCHGVEQRLGQPGSSSARAPHWFADRTSDGSMVVFTPGTFVFFPLLPSRLRIFLY